VAADDEAIKRRSRMTNTCNTCDKTGWVCEYHPDKPWAGVTNRKDACSCGAGMPCEVCKPTLREMQMRAALKNAKWALTIYAGYDEEVIDFGDTGAIPAEEALEMINEVLAE